MCGIGCLFKKNEPVVDDELWDQLRAIKHRGPDGQEVLNLGNIGFSHARLAIQDLTRFGAQPIFRKKHVLVFNGEIYNFPELKKQLQQKYGSVFYSTGDAEVLFEGLFHEGMPFLKKLNGDFAFIWYSSEQKKLYLGRDRLGVKPLYYRFSKSRFLASSEIRGLFGENESKEINRSSLNSFLAQRYVRGESTIYEGTFRVPPAHYMVVDSDLNSKLFKYWDPFESKGSWSYSELVWLLEDSIKIRMRSKVPVGVLLSGGMDSTLVARLAAENSPVSLTSYTCKLPGSRNSELDVKRALQFAESKNFQSHVYEHKDDDLTGPLRALEEPIGDSIISPLYGLINLARNHSKVLLSGEGADEMFAGYGHHYFLTLSSRLPKCVNHLLSRIIPIFTHGKNRILNGIYPANLGSEELLRLQWCLRHSGEFSLAYHRLTDVFSEEQRSTLLGSSGKSLVEETESFIGDYSSQGFLKKLLFLEMKNWLTNYNLLKLDKITGWFGLEGRVPFLDHRIVEKIFQCPEDLLISAFERKPLVRDLCQTFDLSKPKKIPFVYEKRGGAFKKNDFTFPTLDLAVGSSYFSDEFFLSSKRRDLLENLNAWRQVWIP